MDHKDTKSQDTLSFVPLSLRGEVLVLPPGQHHGVKMRFLAISLD
jgi:hypothetical protein